MIEIFIIVIVLCIVAIVAFFICRKCVRSPSERTLAVRNSLVNRNYFFHKNSTGGSASNSAPYRYNNASNQIYTSTTADFDDDSFDRRRILDEEARQRHQDVHHGWAVGHLAGNNSNTETRNLLADSLDEDSARSRFEYSEKETAGIGISSGPESVNNAQFESSTSAGFRGGSNPAAGDSAV